MPAEPESFIIEGITAAGNRFRPSDWADRLCGMMSVFGADQRMMYSPYVRPVTVNGSKAVLVRGELRQIEPAAYVFLRGFARDNELRVIEGGAENLQGAAGAAPRNQRR